MTASTRLAGSPARITEIATYDALRVAPGRDETCTVSYTLSRPAWVRVRVVRRGDLGLLLRTLVDWSPRDEGPHAERWDSRDQSGHVIDSRLCFFQFDTSDGRHSGYRWLQCRAPRVRILTVDVGERVQGKGVAVVSVAPPAGGSLPERGYIVRLYVDYELQATGSWPPQARDPVSVSWNAWGLPGGEHLVTAVADDAHDHLGSASYLLRTEELVWMPRAVREDTP